MEESSISIKILSLDLMSAINKDKLEPSNVSSEVVGDFDAMILENCQFMMVLTISVSIFIGCIIARFISQSSKPIELPKCIIKKEPKPEVNNDKKKVSIFFGTQTDIGYRRRFL
ncbi:hypothetical protein S83_047085 [Arachis hypogaea]